MIYKKILVFILFNLFSLYNSLNIKMCINGNNNNYNLPIRRLENGDHNNLILLNNQITSEWCKKLDL